MHDTESLLEQLHLTNFLGFSNVSDSKINRQRDLYRDWSC
jgi:hypothetical protein